MTKKHIWIIVVVAAVVIILIALAIEDIGGYWNTQVANANSRGQVADLQKQVADLQAQLADANKVAAEDVKLSPPPTPMPDSDATQDNAGPRMKGAVNVVGFLNVFDVNMSADGSLIGEKPCSEPSQAKLAAKAHLDEMEKLASGAIRNARRQACTFGINDYTAQMARKKADEIQALVKEAREEYESTR